MIGEKDVCTMLCDKAVCTVRGDKAVCTMSGDRAVCIVSGSKVSDTVPSDKEVYIVKVPEDKDCLYDQVKSSQQTLIIPHSAR